MYSSISEEIYQSTKDRICSAGEQLVLWILVPKIGKLKGLPIFYPLRKQWYIIAEGVYHHPTGCISSAAGCRCFRNDYMQNFVMMRYNTSCWWYARLRLDWIKFLWIPAPWWVFIRDLTCEYSIFIFISKYVTHYDTFSLTAKMSSGIFLLNYCNKLNNCDILIMPNKTK